MSICPSRLEDLAAEKFEGRSVPRALTALTKATNWIDGFLDSSLHSTLEVSQARGSVLDGGNPFLDIFHLTVEWIPRILRVPER